MQNVPKTSIELKMYIFQLNSQDNDNNYLLFCIENDLLFTVKNLLMNTCKLQGELPTLL